MSVLGWCSAKATPLTSIPSHPIQKQTLRKFRGDLELWLQYLDYCSSTGAHKAHSRALAQALQLFPRVAGLWIRAASYEYFDHASPPAARVLMQRGLRLNGPDSALLWVQYFKLELLYVNKLRGRREALGLEDGPATPREEEEEEEEQDPEEEGGEGVDVPVLEGEEEEEEEEAPVAPTPTENPDNDPRAQSVAAVLAGAVPRVVYLSAIKARPTDLAMRLSFLETLEALGGEEGHFEPLAQEVLAGIDAQFGLADGAWARAKHALHAPAAEDEEKEVGKKSKGSKKRRRASSTSLDETEAWKLTLAQPAKACLTALERGIEATTSGSSSLAMWRYYLRGLTELLQAPRLVVLAALAQAEAQATEALDPAMYLQWAALELSSGEQEEGKEAAAHDPTDKEVEAARGVLGRATAAHPTNARLWEAWLNAEAGNNRNRVQGKVESVFAKAQTALGPTAGMDEGSQDEETRQAIADVWLIYLEWLVRTARHAGTKIEANSSSDDSSDDDDEEEGKQRRAVKVTRALEQAIVSTRGRGRLGACTLWAEWQGLPGLRKALACLGEVQGEDEKEELAALCAAALAKQPPGVDTAGFYEAALGVCGKGQGPHVGALWEDYEIHVRAQGDHKRATNIRWRRDKVTSKA